MPTVENMKAKIRLAVGLAVLAPPPALPAQTAALSVESIFGSSAFTSDLGTIKWTADGTAYTIVEPGAAGGSDLYRVEARTGARELLIRGADLVPPGADGAIEIEDYGFGPNATRVLIYTNSVRVWRANTKGEYFVWDFGTRRLTPVSTKPGYQQFAKFSPDGRYVAFARDHDLFVTDLATGGERQLTTDGSETIINGTTDWVYEEEFGLRDAFRISPDGEHIAFLQFDQSPIKPFYLIDELERYPELVPVRYPKAGTPNSRLRLGVVSVATGAIRWLDVLDASDDYVAEFGFDGAANELSLIRLNRHQNRQDLLLVDLSDGSHRTVMTETDAAWVDATPPIWFDEGRRFLFPSERDGHRHLYLYERDGRLVRQVTSGSWDVDDVFSVDSRGAAVYFSATKDGAAVRPVYRIGLSGTGLARLTDGNGWHDATFNPQASLYLATSSTVVSPPSQSLHRADGGRVRLVSSNAKVADNVRAAGLVAPELLTVPGADGTPLNAHLFKPADFDPDRRYPVVMHVYGGPGSQRVRDAWDGGKRNLWHAMLVEQGYLVAVVDNRGTGGRGRAFTKQTYLRLGQLESDDQIAAARFLASLPYVDAERIGIWGWSYGGYMSLLSLFRGGDVFSAAIAVAPVTDWQLYDTIYTERFMRTPHENPEGYAKGAPLTYADQLQGRLLLIHGTGDDNVHPQNTTQLIHRLEQAGKQFDMRLYPNKTHSIDGATTRVNLYRYMTEWLAQNLKARASPRSAS